MRISLVTLATGEAYRAAVEPGLRSKQRYCRRHGCEFVVAGDEILDPTRPAAWSKIRLLRRELARQDLVFLSDADVVIMNPRIRLEDLQALHLSEPQHHLAMCRDPHALFSTGNILAKNHPWTFDILEAIWSNEEFIPPLVGTSCLARSAPTPCSACPAACEHRASAGFQQPARRLRISPKF